MQVTGAAGTAARRRYPMHALTDTIPPPHIPPRSGLIRLLVRPWNYRHPRIWIGVRLACAIWNLALGLVLLSSPHWIGQYAWLGLIPLTGSVLLFLTVAHLWRSIRG
jgi:hypothetical protein